MKEKLARGNFRYPLHIAEKLHREAEKMGLTKTAFIIMLISQWRGK